MLIGAIRSRAPTIIDTALASRAVPAVLVIVAIVVIALPMLLADPAPLTSDQSLYLSEGYNIATGVGPKYTSQDFVNHRAPLFPALLALPLSLTGGDPASAYWIPKLVMLALAGAVFLLARQLFGTLAGALAAFFVTTNAFLRWLGTSLFLDGTETLFMLLFLSALWRAFQRGETRWFALSGGLLGLAFLTKETAVLWLPLPVAFALLSPEHRRREIVRGLAAYSATVGVMLLAWWGWVFAITDRVYFWGPPNALLLAVAFGAIAFVALLASVWRLVHKRAPEKLPHLAIATGLILVLGWVTMHVLFLETTSWPFPKDHLRAVPQYLWQVATPNSQPWPLVALGLLWVIARSRSSQQARLLTLGLALFVPFALFVANRTFAFRDLLPMLYLAYVGAAGLAAFYIKQASARAGPMVVSGIVVAGIAIFGIVQTQELVNERLPFDRSVVTEANWDNPLVHSTAAWITENVPEGEHIMASRLYFSQLYVLDEARHPIYQLPTLRVEVSSSGGPILERVTTLFRWEDHRLGPAYEDERWLYARRYPVKQYYVALSEHDLLRELEEREIDYLVLTGEDTGFSSFTYLDYFEDNPAFDLVYRDQPSSMNGVVIFRVDRESLAPQDYRAAVSERTLEALSDDLAGASQQEIAALLDPDGIAIRP